MGAIQNAANQLAQTGLGAAVATKHLKQQSDSLKEQEANRKLTGATAAASAQGQLNEVNANLEKGLEIWSKATEEAAQARHDLAEEQKKAGNLAKDKSGRTRTVDPKTGKMGPWYSTKSLEKRETALQEKDAARIAAIKNVQGLYQHRLSVLSKSQKINEVYGENIVDIPGVGAENLEAALKAHPELFEKSQGSLIYEARRRVFDGKGSKFTEEK